MNDDDGTMVMWHTHYPISVVVHFGFDFATNSLRGVQVATTMGFPVTQIKGLGHTTRSGQGKTNERNKNKDKRTSLSLTLLPLSLSLSTKENFYVWEWPYMCKHMLRENIKGFILLEL